MPLPKGYSLDSGPKLPPGYQIDTPQSANLPSGPKAPLPIGLASNAPGDSADWRTRLFGSDGSQMLRNIGQHVKDNVIGLADTALHPGKTVQAVARQTIEAGNQVHPAIQRGDYAGAANHIMDALPVVGPWARNVENEAHQKGAVPALLGLATDAIAPEAITRGVGALARGAGTATRLATASPESMKLAATRAIVSGTPGEVLTRALKPGVKYGADVSEKLQATLPDALRQSGKIGGVGDLGTALDAAKDANAAEHSSVMAPYNGNTPRPLRINGNAVMTEQANSVPRLAEFEGRKPSRLATTSDSPYNRWLPAAEADDVRKGANQKLHSLYQKSEGDQYAALANPEAARIKAVGDNIREQLYPAIETDQGLRAGSIGERQQQYGRLAEASDIANKREVVFSRHDPVSLAEKVATGHGGITGKITNFAVERALRGITDSDALVRSAVDRLQNPAGTPLVSGPIASRVAGGLRLSGQTLRRLSPLSPIFARRYEQESE